MNKEKYIRLHQKLVEGLCAANENEFRGIVGPKAFPVGQEYTMPVLHAMVKMLASSVVNIVMEWEKEAAPHPEENRP